MCGKMIEVGVDIGPTDDRADDHIPRNGGIGRAVAAVAERDPAVRHPGHLSKRAFPRIDHEIAVAHERGSPRDSELVVKRPAVQEAARQSGGTPRFRSRARVLCLRQSSRGQGHAYPRPRP